MLAVGLVGVVTLARDAVMSACPGVVTSWLRTWDSEQSITQASGCL